MTFGQTLRKFMDCVNMKQSQLAEYLDYDVSYISRWCNDLKLPSVRSNSELFRKIIRFILKDCTDQHHVALCHAFNIDLSLSEHSFEEKCIAVLEAAYKESYRIKNSVHTSPASHIINNCNFSQLDMSFESNNSLLAQVTSEIAEHTTDAVLECISMPFSSDYGNNECIPFWMNMVQNLSSNTTLHLRMIADLSDPAHRIHICRDLCSFYSLSDQSISVEFYNIDNTLFTYESLLVLKNRLCVITYLDTLLNVRNVIITQDTFQTERYYGAVNYLLRGRNPLIGTSDFIQLYNRNFFSDFFTGCELFLLTTSLPMFFLKKEMLHSATENIKNQTEILAIYSYYRKTASRWNIYIYKSALTRFLFDGKVSILSHTFCIN